MCDTFLVKIAEGKTTLRKAIKDLHNPILWKVSIAVNESLTTNVSNKMLKPLDPLSRVGHEIGHLRTSMCNCFLTIV